jgi:hypothetical protein
MCFIFQFCIYRRFFMLNFVKEVKSLLSTVHISQKRLNIIKPACKIGRVKTTFSVSSSILFDFDTFSSLQQFSSTQRAHTIVRLVNKNIEEKNTFWKLKRVLVGYVCIVYVLSVFLRHKLV